MNHAQIRAVIFDLDVLLIDSEIISYRLYQELLRPYGHNLTLEDYASGYSGKTAPENMRKAVETFGLPFRVEEGLEKIFAMEREYLERGVALKPGADKLLTYLRQKQYKILLATSSTKDRALTILMKNGIEQFFDHMVFGYEVERGKPWPDIFLKACEKAQEKPENCLVLEDSEAGVQAACAAGIPVICIPDMKRPGEEILQGAVGVMESLEHVEDFLKEQEQTDRAEV